MSVWAPLKLPDSVGGARVPRRTRETPLTLRLAGLGELSESLGSAEALSGSVHSQAVFTAANGPREVCVSLRHPTVSMPSRDAKSHGTDVPWNGDSLAPGHVGRSIPSALLAYDSVVWSWRPCGGSISASVCARVFEHKKKFFAAAAARRVRFSFRTFLGGSGIAMGARPQIRASKSDL